MSCLFSQQEAWMSEEAGQALSGPGENLLAAGEQPLFSHEGSLPGRVQTQCAQCFIIIIIIIYKRNCASGLISKNFPVLLC